MENPSTRIIAAFGGPSALARRTGWPFKTVYSWVRNGIPKWRRADVALAAYEDDIKLTKSEVSYLDPDGSALETYEFKRLAMYPDRPEYQPVKSIPKRAKAAAEKAPILRERMLALFSETSGLTADECAQRLGMTLLSIRPRLTELKRGNLIKDSGERRLNDAGRSVRVMVKV